MTRFVIGTALSVTVGDGAAGNEVEVKGTVQSDGSLAGGRISVGHEGDDADD